GPRRQHRAGGVVVPLPREAGARPALAAVVPSGRSLLVGVALVVGAIGAYWVALTSPLFAVERVRVRGPAPERVVREVERATAHLVGTSLLAIDAEAVERSLRALPSVAGVSVDRAFPTTLVVTVAAERPVAVARRGLSAWLVAGSGRVIREHRRGAVRVLPRIWLPKDAPLAPGRMLPPEALAAARALGAAREAGIRRRIASVRTTGSELTLVLEAGPEIRLGDGADVRLKLAVAGRLLPLLDGDATYLDVSVPERPVAG
ncbi:MAG: FtsQ-type POTRA domain-containing protein, partial [Thermoleophilia bacterium]|nr:FtsQ-type POTRA domain-containing protein [Thermoleophilia bacterium]